MFLSAFVIASALLNPAQILEEEELDLAEQTVLLDQELLEDGEYSFEEGEVVPVCDEDQ